MRWPARRACADWLPTVRRIQAALALNALPAVPSNNDLLAKNIMDDGRIRIIDYDFSGMNDPMFDVGDLAMEGDYDPDQIRAACTAYFGSHDPVQYARASLFGIAAQYTWSLLFVGMDALLTDSPAEGFDYWQEAVVALGLDQAQAGGPVAGVADHRGQRGRSFSDARPHISRAPRRHSGQGRAGDRRQQGHRLRLR